MSLFGGLYVGKSGLQTSQNALNTVAHNLSNLNTTGYVRQQVAQADTNYNTISTSKAVARSQTGDGVKYSECRHIRDTFLDEIYREESGRYSFYESSYSSIMEIEDILGELDGAAFKESVQGLWTAFEELAKSPNDTTYISLLVQKSLSFAENAASVYQSLNEYQNNLNKQIKDAVDEINAIGQRIDELNGEIAKIEVGNLEHANDLRDERDKLLDTLSSYGNITYKEDASHVVSVRFNSEEFVTSAGAYKIGMWQDNTTGFYHPYWEQNVTYKIDTATNEKIPDYSSADVFDVTEIISTERDTDIGELRALLLARGDHVANYTDLKTDKDSCTQRKLEALGISENEYKNNTEKYGKEYYNDYISGSVVMNIQAEFDNIVHEIITKINDVLADNCDPNSGYLCNDDGTPMQMFLKSVNDPYVKETIANPQDAETRIKNGEKLYRIYNEDGSPTNDYWKFIEEDCEKAETLYNCKTIEINQKLVQTPSLLGFKKVDGSADYNLGKSFIKAFEDDQLYLNPNATKPTSYENCYIDMVNDLCTTGNEYKKLYEFEQLSIEQAENNRSTVIGVSSDEELEHMIMYQNAYNAASRYINVINTLLDSVLSMAQ